jgi:hypothetical protein
MAHGIESMHPPVDGKPLSCVRCHGGSQASNLLSEAHVAPGVDDPTDLRSLSHGELDTVTPSYLRFINPGDLRVAEEACGGACHGDTVKAVKTSSMAIKSSSFASGRYRAGQQRSSQALKAIRDATNTRFAVGERHGTVGAVAKLDEPRIAGDEDEPGPYYDLLLSKNCSGCHLYRFADDKVAGSHRSSGCSACHVAYSSSGTSASADPTNKAQKSGRPQLHRMTAKPGNEQCTTCHQAGGARIGLSSQGLRQAASPGFESPQVVWDDSGRWGLGPGRLVAKESASAHYDATPADVHFEAGLSCIDCHTAAEVHGDGHLYSGGGAALEVTCETCHGSAESVADFTTRRGTVLTHLRRQEDGKVLLTSKVTGAEHIVPQTKNHVAAAAPGSQLHASMGRSDSGFSHLDRLDCSACHSAWIPTCYGCHVEVNMAQTQTSQVSGNATFGSLRSTQLHVRTDDLILALDGHDRIKPSMPAERLFISADNGAGERVLDKAPRRTIHDDPGHGHRAVDPHTTRRWSPFMNCRRCHEADSARLAAGYGSDRFLEPDGRGQMHRLDALRDQGDEPLVTFGPRQEVRASALPLDLVSRMLSAEIVLPDCDVDASTALPFSLLQDRYFEPNCSACHDGAAQPLIDHALIKAQSESSPSLGDLLAAGHHGAVYSSCDAAAIEGWIAGGRRND